MLNYLENYYLSLPEPEQSTFLFLRNMLLNFSPKITEHYKYKLPFFYYNGKMFCYLWIEKKQKRVYIGFMNGAKLKHKALLAENRKMVKVLYIQKNKDIDVNQINEVLLEAESFMK